jgi:hypothetical protein
MNIITAQQAKLAHTYKNIKLKILKCNASIWFNRQCKVNNLTPKYAQFNTKSQNEKHIVLEMDRENHGSKNN